MLKILDEIHTVIMLVLILFCLTAAAHKGGIRNA